MDKKRSFFNLEETLKQAVKTFSVLNPAEIAANAGVELGEDGKTLKVPFIDQYFLVKHPEGKVKTPDGEEASIYLAIIILHYLATADGKALTGRWIAYRHLPGGDIYIEPFQKRAVKPFLKTFGERPEDFKKAAMALGGYSAETSGISMVIPVMPRVPVCFSIWPGDDELPASANILFDEAASSYLPTEDYAHLPAIINGVMKKITGG